MGMEWTSAAALLLGGLMAMMLLGLPVAFAFLAVNLLGAVVFLGGEAGLGQLVRNAVGSVASFSLTPILFFVLMGAVMFHTGVALRAIDAVDRLIVRVPGRLAVVAIVAGTIFSAISGSTIATTALLGTLLLPQMLRRGYEPRMAMGPIMGIGGVDILIPPSALAVLLGSLAGISISKLLIAGIVPGVLLSAAFVGYIVIRCRLDPRLAPEGDVAPMGLWQRVGPFVRYVLPLAAIFVFVVGSMAAGWATPTESAALGAAAAIAVAGLYRMLSVASLVKALLETVTISGMILFIIVGSTTFSQLMAFSGATTGFVGLVTGWDLGAVALVLAIAGVLLVLGCFIDQVSMMMITLPFVLPVAQAAGIDPVWLGVVYLMCMQLGLLTPPFGLLLFTMKGVAPPGIAMGQIYAAASPYVILGFLLLLLIVALPSVVTWLPSVMLE